MPLTLKQRPTPPTGSASGTLTLKPALRTQPAKPLVKGPGLLHRSLREKWLMLFAQAVTLVRERLIEARGAPKGCAASSIASARRWAKEARYYYAQAMAA